MLGDGNSVRVKFHIFIKIKYINDTPLHTDNLTESFFFQTVYCLNMGAHHDIILHTDKFMFADETVEYAGFKITLTNVWSCKKYLDTTLDFPTLANRAGMHGLLVLTHRPVSYTLAFAVTDHMLV